MTAQDQEYSKDKQTLSRRELLKALAATGGALATTAFLPNRWRKPAVEVGGLPAHALQTPTQFGVDCHLFRLVNSEWLEITGDVWPGVETLRACVEIHPNWPNIPIHILVTRDGETLADWYGYTQPDGTACTGSFTRDFIFGEVVKVQGSVVGTPFFCEREYDVFAT